MLRTEELTNLVGSTIIGWQDAEPGDPYGAQVLILKKGRKVTAAFILQDEEGNGPGHLELNPQTPATAKKILAEAAARKKKATPSHPHHYDGLDTAGVPCICTTWKKA